MFEYDVFLYFKCILIYLQCLDFKEINNFKL